MAISTAAAIIGSAVVGAGASALSSASAAKKAAKASNYAADQNAAVSREIYNQTRSDLAPYNTAGQGALSALMVRLGIQPMSGAQGSATRPQPQVRPATPSAPTGLRSAAQPGSPNLGGGQPLGSAPGGVQASPGNTGPPGPAPAGQKWVHGPEGWALFADTPSRSFGETMGGLGLGGPQKTMGGPAGTSPLEPANGQPAPYGGNAGQGDMSNPAYMTMGGQSNPGAPSTAPFAPGSFNFGPENVNYGPQGPGAPAAPQAPAGPDWSGYLSGNPDVAQWAQQAVAQGAYASPEEAAQFHYQQYGQTEGRPLPGAQGSADPNAAPEQYYQEEYGQRPEDLAIPTYERGPDVQFQDYGQGPQFQGVSWKDIENDPGFQWEMEQGLNGVNARSAVAGKLRSGDAAKALQREGYGIAHSKGADYFNRALSTYDRQRGAFQDNRNFGTDQSRYFQDRGDRNYLDDRSYGTNVRFQEQGRRDNIFADERNFAANRNDVATNNLFNLVNVGTGAAAGAANAGNVFASNTINSNNQRAATTANAAIANGQNISNLFGSAAGAVGTYYGLRGGGAGASLPRTYSI